MLEPSFANQKWLGDGRRITYTLLPDKRYSTNQPTRAITTCGCKKLACQSNCSNPHAVLFDIGDESDDDSETKSD